MTLFVPASSSRLLSQTIVWLSRHTALGRGAMRKAMANSIRRLNPNEPLEVSLYGSRARLHTSGNGPEMKALLKPQRYARNERAFCQEYMQTDGGVFLDIGANAGVISLFVASLMRSGTLIAAEPQPEMFARLSTNFACNPDLSARLNIHLRQTAIGGYVPGNLTLGIPEDAGEASAHKSANCRRIDVPLLPMLDLLMDCAADRVDVLKIDIEGAEDSVLFPFFSSARENLHPKAIVMETCNSRLWTNDCVALLLNHGYRIVDKDRVNMMLVLGH